MPKDNENISLNIAADDPEIAPPSPFAPDQMLRCETCLRANPPTRINCLYCGASLPLNETSVKLQRPALRPLEEWEQGYNNILIPPVANLDEASLNEAADLLRLRRDDFAQILAAQFPLPLARASSIDEAELVKRRLTELGINSIIVADRENHNEGREVTKIRAIDIDEQGIYAYQSPETPSIQLAWADVVLLVTGRLLARRVELKEAKGKRAENKILAASEFATDERVVDFYVRDHATPFRITANSFDFSFLGSNKSLLAGENIERLVSLFRERAPGAAYDDSFNSVRRSLELVWPSAQQNESTGWRRERPGKISLGTVTESNNETQFLRYSRLRFHLLTSLGGSDKDNA